MSAATPSPLCRVVVSYARKDEVHRQTLRTHVADMERGGVEFFDDRAIPAGALWEQALVGALEQADIVVLLITANYVASDFCMVDEFGVALRRWEAGECQLFPVYVAPVDVAQDSPLRKLQWTPSGKPITGFGSAAAGQWRRVAQELRKLTANTKDTEDTEDTGDTEKKDSTDRLRRPAAPAMPHDENGEARTPEGQHGSISNTIIGGSIGTWTQIGNMDGNLTIHPSQPPPDDGPVSRKRSR